MELRLHILALAAAASVACAYPTGALPRRSPLVEVPRGPLTPEGRPRTIPGAAPVAAAAAASQPQVPGEQLAQTARRFLGRKSLVVGGKRFPDDCAGLVRAVYAEHGVALVAREESLADDNAVTAIYRFAANRGALHHDAPRPGDLVFFRETYDRNRDGRENDGLTHVAIVESIEADGTVNIVHRVTHGVVRDRMNLARPHARRDEATGRIVNDYLREGARPRFAAELFESYARL